MTERTARQIEGMKNDYNFGVEVEMNHITRQELLRKLRHAGAVSNPSIGAGVHIHVSRKGGF